jgi:hypothetical protein
VRPTSPTTLVALAVSGGALMYAGEMVLVRMGQPTLIPPVTLAIALALLGVIIPILAWPIRQLTRSTQRSSPVDPFYATRVLLVAKAGSVTAAGLLGVGVGAAVFVLGRMVVVWSQVVETSLTIAGSVLLLVGALVAERWCVLPPSDEAESSAAPEGEPA